MEPNKLENQIKEKLNSREIQPSAQAWDRLDAMLSVAEEKKTKRSFGWLYIAASITVLLIAGMFFFSQKNTEISPENNVVETEVKKDSVQKEQNNTGVSPIVNENQEKQVVVSSETQNQKSQNTNNNQRVSITNQKSNKNQSNNPLINRSKDIEYQNSSDVALKDLPKIETKKELIVNRPAVTNAKTDEQLLAGLDNAAKESTNTKSSIKVDAKSLLSQVDGELELTFREKVISKVAKNYKEVKVALANRNKE